MNIFTKLLSLFSSPKENSEEKLNTNTSLKVSNELKDFLENEVLDGLEITPEKFWSSFEEIVNEFSPKNKELLAKREDIQSKIDHWHRERKGSEHDHSEYKKFLEDIGYIVARSPDFSINTDNVDPEIKSILD